MSAYSSSAAWITHTLLTTVSVIKQTPPREPPIILTSRSPTPRALLHLLVHLLSVKLKSFRKTSREMEPRINLGKPGGRFVKWQHLMPFLCVFSVRKISSLLGISVEPGKNGSGSQDICFSASSIWFKK